MPASDIVPGIFGQCYFLIPILTIRSEQSALMSKCRNVEEHSSSGDGYRNRVVRDGAQSLMIGKQAEAGARDQLQAHSPTTCQQFLCTLLRLFRSLFPLDTLIHIQDENLPHLSLLCDSHSSPRTLWSRTHSPRDLTNTKVIWQRSPYSPLLRCRHRRWL